MDGFAVKACPQCKQQFDETDEFCPEHGVRLLGLTAVAGGGAVPVGVGPGYDAYDRLIGTTLEGRYTLEAKLGEGGMGVVFKAHHTVIEKPVAVKILKREVARDNSVVQRFLQEAKAASRIGHPNIVDVTDFGTLRDGSVYYVMEFIGGRTLSKAMREDAPFPLARALPIVAQLARALGAAHDKGVVHRDLKPENIFLIDREGRRDFVKIVDFGIAKMAPTAGTIDGPRLTRAGSVFGTPEYMAPEQAAGRSDTDARVDVYALGTIFYEMVVGRVPHKGESLVATIAMQMLDTIVPPRQAAPEVPLSEELEAVIMKALAKERDQRYASMAELLGALEGSAGGVPLDPLSSTGSVRIVTAPGSLATPPRGTPALPAAAPTLPASTPAPVVVRPGAGAETMPEVEPSFSAEQAAVTGRARSRRYGAWAAVLLVVAVGAVAAAFVARRGGGASEASPGDLTGTAPADAGGSTARIATPPDAGAAARTRAPDAGATIVASTSPDAGTHRPPRVPTPPTPPVRDTQIDVVVRTQPPGGDLRVDGANAGTDGTTFRRAKGTKLVVQCVAPEHDPGTVTVTFDKPRSVTCTMRRKTKCVEQLKNPFDPCPK